jgi:hypothetical protein
MTPEQIALVEWSFAGVGPQPPALGAHFYRQQFLRDPALGGMSPVLGCMPARVGLRSRRLLGGPTCARRRIGVGPAALGHGVDVERDGSAEVADGERPPRGSGGYVAS